MKKILVVLAFVLAAGVALAGRFQHPGIGLNREQLDQLATQLYEKEVLFREDLERIYGPRPWESETPQPASAEAEPETTAEETENKDKDFEEV